MNKRKELWKKVECPDGSIKRIRVWSEINNDCNNAKKVPNIYDDLIIDNDDGNDELDAFFVLQTMFEPYIPEEEETVKERNARYRRKRKENGKLKETNDKTYAKRKKNGKQKESNDRNKENGKIKEWRDKTYAKRKANGKIKEANHRTHLKRKENGKQKEWSDKYKES